MSWFSPIKFDVVSDLVSKTITDASSALDKAMGLPVAPKADSARQDGNVHLIFIYIYFFHYCVYFRYFRGGSGFSGLATLRFHSPVDIRIFECTCTSRNLYCLLIFFLANSEPDGESEFAFMTWGVSAAYSSHLQRLKADFSVL